MVAGFTTWRTQHFRPTDNTPTAPIKQPRHENHPHAVTTTANMAEEQSEKFESIVHEEHNRPTEPTNPPKRARTDNHDTTQVGVTKGSVTLVVGPGLENNGLVATLEHESENMFSSSEAEDSDMDDDNIVVTVWGVMNLSTALTLTQSQLPHQILL